MKGGGGHKNNGSSYGEVLILLLSETASVFTIFE